MSDKFKNVTNEELEAELARRSAETAADLEKRFAEEQARQEAERKKQQELDSKLESARKLVSEIKELVHSQEVPGFYMTDKDIADQLYLNLDDWISSNSWNSSSSSC